MLTIRAEQMEVFGTAMHDAFQHRMVRHVNAHFPEVTAEMGEENTAKTVAAAWELAKRYRFETEYGVCQFINFVFALGADFETAPWAVPLLAEANESSERVRADRLHAAAVQALERQR